MSKSTIPLRPTDERVLVAPELSFDLAAEAQSLRTSALYLQGKHTARTLTMHPDFRVVLIAMPLGSQLRRHQTTQRISVHVLTGHVTLTLPDHTLSLTSGSLLALDKSIAHDVTAIQDSTVLLSLSGIPHRGATRADPLDSLTQEHRRFAKLLDLVSDEMEQFRNGKQPDGDLLRDIFDYMTNYPDRLHHPYEDVIFEKIVERVPAVSPYVESLTQQHRSLANSGAQFLSRLQSALDGTILPREAVEGPALEYISLYREHIRIEEEDVFPLCRQHLRREDWDFVAQSFHEQEDPLAQPCTNGKYLALHRQMLGLLALPKGSS